MLSRSSNNFIFPTFSLRDEVLASGGFCTGQKALENNFLTMFNNILLGKGELVFAQ